MKTFFKRLFQKHVKFETPAARILVEPEENYYRTTTKCTNCATEINLVIKKGIYAKYAIPTVRCPNCGCKSDRGEK
jgi:hypothetical protein